MVYDCEIITEVEIRDPRCHRSKGSCVRFKAQNGKQSYKFLKLPKAAIYQNFKRILKYSLII